MSPVQIELAENHAYATSSTGCYECAPIAFVIEQAGGKASDGSDPIMCKTAQSLHARTPLVFGSAEKVNRVAAYYDLPDHEVSALFGERGLFRA